MTSSDWGCGDTNSVVTLSLCFSHTLKNTTIQLTDRFTVKTNHRQLKLFAKGFVHTGTKANWLKQESEPDLYLKYEPSALNIIIFDGIILVLIEF